MSESDSRQRGAGVRWSVRTSLLGAAIIVVLVACGESTILQHVLSINISATPTTATVGDEVTFNFDATGPILVGVTVSYGDGVVDSVATTNVTSASGRLIHTFQTEGSFLVEATVVDGWEGTLTDTVSVQILP